MRRLVGPELRGILGLLVAIAAVGAVLAASSGKLEQWFGITILSGPKALDKIVFVSDNDDAEEICLMNPDGSERMRLTEGGHVYSMPTISPTGTRIAYVGRFQNQDQIFAVGAKGGTPDRLTSATGPKKLPCYSPDGARLAFIASGRVYVAETNGDSPQPVLPTREQLHEAMANPLMRNQAPAYHDYAWQPNSTGMVGVTRNAGENDVLYYLSKPDGAPNVVGIAAPGMDPGLALGALINYLLQQTGGTNKRIQAGERVRVAGLSWAVDTDMLAVTVNTAKRGFLLVLLIEDGKPKIAGFRPLDGQEVGRPSVSPDGTKIALAVKSLDSKAASGMLVLDVQEGAGHLVAGGLFENPCYSPTGDAILATGIDDQGARDVVVIDPSTGDVKQLTTDGHSHSAIWTPTSGK